MVAVALMLSAKVSAHVTVQPRETVAGYTVSSLRVPNEKDLATTQVRVVVPDAVDVYGIMPVAGWKYTMKHEEAEQAEADHDGDDHAGQGRITEITWSGGKIGAGEFMEFPLSVQYSADSDKVTWKAYQTYADGEVVPWDGTDEKHPAPTVVVLKTASTVTAPKASKDAWMSVAALLLSVTALAMSLKKKA